MHPSIGFAPKGLPALLGPPAAFSLHCGWCRQERAPVTCAPKFSQPAGATGGQLLPMYMPDLNIPKRI